MTKELQKKVDFAIKLLQSIPQNGSHKCASKRNAIGASFKNARSCEYKCNYYICIINA